MTQAAHDTVLKRMLDHRMVAVLRGESADAAYETARAVFEGGVHVLEITMTVPGAPEAIERLTSEPDAVVGAGSVCTAVDVDRCVDAGASFIVSPACVPEVIARASERGVVVIPGAMTPTEVLTAWTLGGDLVKVFPAGRLGPQYLKDLHGPLPQIPLVPTGGLTGDNVQEYLDAGAALVCFGSWLTKGDRAQVMQRAGELAALINAH